jgi:hypothetical protein
MAHSQPAQYSFITKWQIKAPLGKVWDAIDKGEDWPIWWKGAEQTEIIDNGNIDGTGKTIRYKWKSFLPFTLSFDFKITDRELYKKISGEATGDLKGTGIWTFEETNGITHVQYKWDVVSTKKIINLLSPFLKWFFNYNHNLLMHWGAKGLAKKLHAKLLEG